MRPVFIKTFGCKVNYSESVSFADLLRGAGFTPLEIGNAELPGADEIERPVIFINSCCVTLEAERKAAQFVRRVKRLCPDSEVLFSGCGARNYAARAQYADAGARVFDFYPEAFAWLQDNAPRISSAGGPARDPLETKPISNTQMAGTAARPTELPTGIVGESRSRAFIKLQDGCHNCCSFCIIPFVRPYASRPFDEIMAELDLRLQSGIREIVLTGVNIGHYGLTPIASVHEVASREHFKRSKLYQPIPGHPTLWDLIDAMLARLDDVAQREGIEARLRISSIEPEEIEPRFFEQLAHPRMCPHLHLPLQSGSERVLAEMRRLYTLDTYMQRVESFRAACPFGALTTDIITGYPGETEAEFAETLAACNSAGFERVHAFPFSPRPGTRAAQQIAVGAEHARPARGGDSLVAGFGSAGRWPALPSAGPAALPLPFSKSLALERNRRLIAHSTAIAAARAQRFIGRDCAVLIESRVKGLYEGHGEAYQQVRFPVGDSSRDLIGEIVNVRLQSVEVGLFDAVMLEAICAAI